jgi:HlyD family secretion protein
MTDLLAPPQVSPLERPEDVIEMDIRRHARVGYLILGGLGAVVLGWGVLANIASAVVAPGKVTLENSVKRVQHKEGGIVSEVLVNEGDRVRAGDLLARIDATVPQANLTVINNQYEELIARRLRLEAERDGLTTIPAAALASTPDTPSFQRILAAENRLMAERRALRAQKKAQLAQQMTLSRQEIQGLQAQATSQAAQRELINGELAGVRQLYAKGLATLPRVNALEREAKRLDGSQGELIASVAQARTKISEIQVQSLQVDSEELAAVMTDLKDTEIKLAQITEQRATGQDELRRLEVRAPTDGQVQSLAVHTRGGVVGAGETLMMIVPERDELIVEASIRPENIDQVAPGQAAKVRFTAFSAPNTPVLDAKVDRLSTDVQTNERTGQQFYVARLRIRPAHLDPKVRARLVAGMPAEVQIAGSSRSAISYFLKPLSDQLERTFRED